LFFFFVVVVVVVLLLEGLAGDACPARLLSTDSFVA